MEDKLLPSQQFTTANALLGVVDHYVMVALRDGKRLYGVLRSFDQFANLVIQDTVERIYVDGAYAEQPRGIYLVRGENVALMAEIDVDKEDWLESVHGAGSLSSLQMIPFCDAEAQVRDRAARAQAQDKLLQRRLLSLGLLAEDRSINLY